MLLNLHVWVPVMEKKSQDFNTVSYSVVICHHGDVTLVLVCEIIDNSTNCWTGNRLTTKTLLKKALHEFCKGVHSLAMVVAILTQGQ